MYVCMYVMYVCTYVRGDHKVSRSRAMWGVRLLFEF